MPIVTSESLFGAFLQGEKDDKLLKMIEACKEGKTEPGQTAVYGGSSMRVLPNDNCVFFDVDDTLIICNPSSMEGAIELASFGRTWKVFPHLPHIQELKNHKFRRHQVIVWSAGGWEWAELVVKALGLEEYVDVVMSKPKWIYDDLPLTELATHIYKEPT